MKVIEGVTCITALCKPSKMVLRCPGFVAILNQLKTARGEILTRSTWRCHLRVNHIEQSG
jgi:hypothetical protein